MKISIIIILFTSTLFSQNLLLNDDYSPKNFEVVTYQNSMTTKLSDSQLNRLDKWVTMMKDTLGGIDSLSERLDFFYWHRNETLEAAKKNVVKRSFDCTGTITFTKWSGIKGNGSTYLSTNYNPSTQATTYTLNDASLGIYSNTNETSTNGTDMGYDAAERIMSNYPTNNFYAALNCAQDFIANGGSTLGLRAVTRSNSTTMTLYINATGTGRSKTTSAIPNGIINICRRTSTGNENTVREYSCAWAGAGFSATEMRGIYNCIMWYINDCP